MPSNRLVVIGNFDGVHLGHQAVLTRAGREAARLGLLPTVLTFDPHPTLVLTGKARPNLTSLERKRRLLEAVVPNLEVWVEPFSTELSRLSPRDFAARVLVERLSAQLVLVGGNFRFGYRRQGDLSTLQSLGADMGFEARAEELVGDEHGSYSSTRIRELLARGEVEEASRILGRPHLFVGKVTVGDQRGRKLGFPTANLSHVEQVLPGEGVYAVHVYDADRGGEHLGAGVANLGARPTVDRPPSNEVHLIDRTIDLYGKRLGVTLLQRLRGTERFASLTELKAQIDRDVSRAAAAAHHMPSPKVPSWW